MAPPSDGEYASPRVGGGTVERMWTCIAAVDANDDPDLDSVGRRMIERVAAFAYKHEAEAWLEEQREEKFTAEAPTPLATGYHGPTDSPSNCWGARATRVAE